MITKLDKFSEALQKRNPDDSLVAFFNDMYDEAEATERYIEDVEYTNLSLQLKTNSTLNLLASSQRLRKSCERTLRQLKQIRI